VGGSCGDTAGGASFTREDLGAIFGTDFLNALTAALFRR
jgi:hypothetical protein